MGHQVIRLRLEADEVRVIGHRRVIDAAVRGRAVGIDTNQRRGVGLRVAQEQLGVATGERLLDQVWRAGREQHVPPGRADPEHLRAARRSARHRDRDRGQRVRGAITQVHLLVVPWIWIGRRQEPRDKVVSGRRERDVSTVGVGCNAVNGAAPTDPATALAVHADVWRAVRHAGQINRIGRGDAALGVGQVVGGVVGPRGNRRRIKHDLLTATRERPRLAGTRGAGERERPVGAGTVEIDAVDGHRTTTTIRPRHRLRYRCGSGTEINRPGERGLRARHNHKRDEQAHSDHDLLHWYASQRGRAGGKSSQSHHRDTGAQTAYLQRVNTPFTLL